MGKLIQYYLMDDKIQGRIKCTKDNWTGAVYKIPRTSVSECVEPVFDQTGVYFLFGSDEENEDLFYVGQAVERNAGDGILKRIKEHIKNPEKDYFSEVVIITTTDNSMDQAEISYLENYFYNLAKTVNRYEVKNKIEPVKGNVTEEKESSYKDFAEQVTILIGVLGYKVFEKAYDPKIESEIIYKFNANDVDARGVLTSEGFVVLKGSKISSKEKKHSGAWAKRLRDEYGEYINNYETLKDLVFKSPSAAGCFVYNTVTDGQLNWKHDGKTLKEIEEVSK